MINTYCWISQTFLIPAAFSRQVGLEVPHPGVDNSFNRAYNVPPESSAQTDPLVLANGALDESSPQRKYYPYYQWICFVLFIQAIIFYLPHYIWKGAEGLLMQTLTMGSCLYLTLMKFLTIFLKSCRPSSSRFKR